MKKTMTLDEAYAMIHENAVDGNETYVDIADRCNELSQLVNALVTVYKDDDKQDASDVEKILLPEIANILEHCASMLVQCDEYYRYC